ncbi:MAG: putative glycoside hydrolase [Actinomycetota bacterium]
MRWGRLASMLLLALVAAGCGADRDDDAGSDSTDDAAATADAGTGDDGEDGGTSGDTAGGDDDVDGDTAEAHADDDAGNADAGNRADDRTEEAEVPTEVTATVVSAVDGEPIAGVVVTSVGAVSDDDVDPITTDADGAFTIEADLDQPLLIRLPTWLPVAVDPSELASGDTIELQPVVARGVRVSREVAADGGRFDDLLDLIAPTTVNALVFDTKDETGQVLYRTDVAKAAELGAVEALYRPDELLARADDAGLYPITRVVTFEDDLWSEGDAEAKLAGDWVDATDPVNWEYPLALAAEACALGFAEVQFDYVRYPAGRTAEVAADLVPRTPDERSAVIAAFLTEAGERLAPFGCGVSAAIFGIVMSSETDEGIGQTVEAIGPVVDALSPMLYPSHYGPGWLGFADPNDHPGPVIADALDDGLPRLAPDTQMRPWIQAFYYNGAQIGAQISEAESRGAGWLLWNASGNYRADWLPVAP